MKKIVVPVDFSEDSLRALDTAILMARKMKAGLELIHVNKVKSYPGIFSKAQPTEDNDVVEHNFKDLLNHTDHQGIEMNYHIRTGSVSKEIVKFAEEIDAYMIIMGTHGHSGFEEFWAGSNSYKVVSNATCPVITMRGSFNKNGIRKIVLPLDTSNSTRQKSPLAMEMANYFDAEVHVIGVLMYETTELVTKLTTYVAQVAEFLENDNIGTVTEMITGDNVTDMTIAYAKKVDADLIIIMTEQETAYSNMVLGTYAQQMVHHSSIPVMSMHRNEALLDSGPMHY